MDKKRSGWLDRLMWTIGDDGLTAEQREQICRYAKWVKIEAINNQFESLIKYIAKQPEK